MPGLKQLRYESGVMVLWWVSGGVNLMWQIRRIKLVHGMTNKDHKVVRVIKPSVAFDEGI